MTTIFKYKNGINVSLIKLEDDGTFKYDNKRPLFEVNNLKCSGLSKENGLILKNPDMLRKLELFSDDEWDLAPLFRTKGPMFTKHTSVFNDKNEKIQVSSIQNDFTCSILLEPRSLSYFKERTYLNVILHQIKIHEHRELPLGCVLCQSLSHYVSVSSE